MRKKILLISVILSLLSLFTPIIFHVSTYSVYQFWSWGFALSFRMDSGEIGITYNNETTFLIPALSAVVLTILGCGLILYGLKKDNSKHAIIGSSIMIGTPLLLSLLWQLIHVLIVGYPTFWGSSGGYNYFLPSFSMFFQLLAGVIAEIIMTEFSMVPLYLFLIAIFFVVLSIAPHIHVVALKSWYGVESEGKK